MFSLRLLSTKWEAATKSIALVGLAILVASCVTQGNDRVDDLETREFLWANPRPTPNYLVSLPPNSIPPNTPLCVEINVSVLWDGSSDLVEFIHYLTQHFSVSVDGERMDQIVLTSPFSIFEPEGAQGSRNVLATTCPNYANLEQGLHTGNISIRIKTGESYTFEWVFRVEE